MPKFCTVCGRRLTTSRGPIGPVCLRKIQGRKRRIYRFPKEWYIKYMKEHDIFAEENSGPKEDAKTSSGSEKQTLGKESQEDNAS